MHRIDPCKILVLLIAVLLIVIPLYGLAAQENGSGLTPKEIVDRVDRMLRGDSSIGAVKMSIVTNRWKRTMTLRIWSEGTEKVLVKVLKPKKEEGTATLKVESDIWNYLPKIDRTIRVPTSMMMASWMGSHFTNDDLVKESRLIRDYDIRISYEGKRDGVEVYEFTLTPYPDAPVVWGKILYEVRKQDLMPTWAKYYGEDGRLKRIQTFSSYQKMGGRLIPTRMRMEPQDKPGESTEIVQTDLKFDIPIPERTFSLGFLRR
ncbi:MAG: outer membrane lipoprotein-sorting protein [Thermodesulfobacteriota bacterium]